MANLQQRGGKVQVRVGGNTQETAVLVDSTPDGKILEKDLSGVTNPTAVILTPSDARHKLPRSYSPPNCCTCSLTSPPWSTSTGHLGIPFNDSSNFRLGIVEAGEAILGYGPFDYFREVGLLIDAMGNDTNIANENLLAGPNVATGDWTPEMVWDTGFVDSYSEQLAWLGVEHYPTDNCFAQFGTGTFRDPQLTFPDHLNHSSGQSIVAPYLNSTNFAQTKNKKLIMFETNTASCGGFAGISDSFGAALWGLDYGMQMAYSKFLGGAVPRWWTERFLQFFIADILQPFTPPPTNQSTFNQWTIGPIYYSALVMAEAIGATGTAQVQDLNANGGSIYTPAYVIYENNVPKRVMVFNYITDSSGASDVTVSLAIGGGQTGEDGSTPGSVKVKYLQAASVSQKGNITWAGQTFGENFGSDGRLQGSEDITTVQCDSSSNTYSIKVPAPSVDLIFLTDSDNGEEGASQTTFATTVLTKTANTATINPSILATSNGHTDMEHHIGGTSKGKAPSHARRQAGIGLGVVVGAVGVGVGVVIGRWW
ncbi:hypothetical protein BDQ17DRAFT_1412398 [Cyathus striatus]|nr:hypothetical protein BDQ17DRAFT_1412398 [Cyathus striatus]